MTQFECTECGQLGRFVEQRAFEMECPACGEHTRWEVAFEDEAMGVDF